MTVLGWELLALWFVPLAVLVAWSYGRYRWCSARDERETIKRLALAQYDDYSAWVGTWP